MEGKSWVLLDTETTGFRPPIFTVEIAAQNMVGWRKSGPVFRRLINWNREIPREATRVHGYTKEVLAKDGVSPLAANKEFNAYVGTRVPFVSYNLSFDWDKVLVPEWSRLGIQPIGIRGFCALRLAQRLLDPCPAGNCQLQTLRQYYDLNGGLSHTAIADVETTSDLLIRILKPIADGRGLKTWEDLERFSEEKFFPSKIPFGKFKGRDFKDAAFDFELRSWIEWFALSGDQNSEIGAWYLKKLGILATEKHPPPGQIRSTVSGVPSTSGDSSQGSLPQNSSKDSPTEISDPPFAKQLFGCLIFGILALLIFRGFIAFLPSSQSKKPTEIGGIPKPTSEISGMSDFDPQEVQRMTISEPAQLPTPFREWEDLTGRRKIMQALSINSVRETVVFRHENGQIFPEIPIGSLVRRDRDYLLGGNASQ